MSTRHRQCRKCGYESTHFRPTYDRLSDRLRYRCPICKWEWSEPTDETLKKDLGRVKTIGEEHLS